MKSNKFGLMAAIALAGFLATDPLSSAQDAAPPSTPSTNTPPAVGRGAGRGRALQAALDKLDLTADQKTKVDAALKEQQAKVAALRADTSLAQEDRRPKMMEIQTAFMAKLKTILTPDQYTKLEESRSAPRH